MRCPNHSRADVIGYCSVCGEFGCEECLTLHEGNLLCSKHYRPIARKLEDEKKHEDMRKRHPRQRLVVRYMDGRCLYGMCYGLNTREAGFHLDMVDATGTTLGKTDYVRFSDLKAVFLVKSFDGRFDKTVRHREWTAEGHELVIEFLDGEILQGFSLHRYDPEDARFHLIPSDPSTNNISVLVERSAVKAVSTPEEYNARLTKQREATGTDTPVQLSQEETTGDFYFETRNYTAALEQYRLAAARFPKLRRLHKKMFLTLYNVGVNHIKRHEYEKALDVMEGVLRMDPHNERVKKKVHQLRHIIQKAAGPKDASSTDQFDEDTEQPEL